MGGIQKTHARVTSEVAPSFAFDASGAGRPSSSEAGVHGAFCRRQGFLLRLDTGDASAARNVIFKRASGAVLARRRFSPARDSDCRTAASQPKRSTLVRDQLSYGAIRLVERRLRYRNCGCIRIGYSDSSKPPSTSHTGWWVSANDRSGHRGHCHRMHTRAPNG